MSMVKRVLRRLKARVSESLARLRPLLIQGLTYGEGSRVYELVRFRVTDGGKCHIGHEVAIERFSEITASGGVIEIGDKSFIGQGSVIVARAKISIGDNCLIAENVTIRDQNHRVGLGGLVRNSGFDVGEIEIGDNVWIGAKACILAGVQIGEGSVVGAGSVVTKSLPARVVAGGNPARVLREI